MKLIVKRPDWIGIQLLRIMKLTIILLTLTALQVSATGHGQGVTLNLKDVSLEKIFKEIRRQSGYLFLYKNEEVRKAGKVSVNVKDATVEEALSQSLASTRFNFKIIDKTIVLSPKPVLASPNIVTISEPPPTDVKGKVANKETGAPIANASVQVKGTTRGTATNSQGEFEIEAAEGAILVISSVGFESYEVKITNASKALVVSLNAKVDPLAEVIVTALGITTQKKAIGYSIQEVDGSKLTQARETNVLNSLKGRVAGVHINPSSAGPGGSSYILIRGNNSLRGNSQPLIVVDGIPINNDNLQPATLGGGKDFGDGIKDINPDDIESVSVLKGPNAATLYGARGGNGVVLITTKKGTRKGLGISVNSNATFDILNLVPTHQNKWAPGYDGDFSSWNKVTINGTEYIQQPSWLLDNWGGPLDGRLISVETWPELGLIPLTAQPDDNLRSFYQTGTTYTNTVSLTSVSDKINFRASLSDLSNKGIIPKSSLDRKTITLLVGANITNKLYAEAKANYINQTTHNRPILAGTQHNPALSLNVIPRYLNIDLLKDYKRPDGSMRHVRNNFPDNPYWIINELPNDDRRDRLIGYISLNYKFTDWLSLKARTGTDTYTDVRNERTGQKTPGVLGGSVQNVQHHINEMNSDVLLTASGKISGNFTGSISAGANRYTKRYEITGASGIDLIADGQYIVSNTKVQNGIYSLVRKQINSAYLNGQLGYKNYAFLDVSARNDWSSTLSKANRSFFYPSVSLSGILTDALNIKSNLLNYAKLRASYAQAGSDGDPYLTQAGYSVANNGFNGLPFANISGNIPALDLKNELNSSWEIGTDLRLLKNRLALDFTYYNSSTTNQIINVQIPAPTGFYNKLINTGEIKNKGIEIFASYKALQLKNSFNWDISVNFSKNKSKVVSIYPGIETIVLSDIGWETIEARPGEPYGNIISYPYKRSPEGRLLVDENGVAISDYTQKKVFGNIQPRWLAGITNTFSFKGFTLSGLLDVRSGGKIVSYTMFDQMAKGTGKFTENATYVEDALFDDGTGVLKENTKEINRQQYWANGKAWASGSEIIRSASYVALREATLGYDFKPAFLSKIKISSARFSIVGRNLLYLHRDSMFKIMGISPETSFAPTAAAQGWESFNLPTTRSLGFNLSLSF